TSGDGGVRLRLKTDLPLWWRVRAGVAGLVIPLLLLVAPLDRITRLLGRGRARESWRALPDKRVAHWIDNLLARLPWPWRHTCLRRSAVLYHILRRHGREVELMVGVRRDERDALAAHAWLTLDSTPYLES